MPLERPTLTQLVERVEGDVASRLGLGALLEHSNLKVHALVMAGAAHALHGHLAYIADQVIWDSAEAEFLERWGSIFGEPRVAAAYAQGSVTMTGADATTVPSGTLVQRADGVEFATDADVTVAAGTATVAVTALEAGNAGNTPAATIMGFTSPIAGMDDPVTVDSGAIIGGGDAETDEDYRNRFVGNRQSALNGGSTADYIRWTLEVPDVTRAFCLPGYLGAGKVGVTFMVDNLDEPIPTAEKVQEVADYLDVVRPVTVKGLLVFAPFEVELDLTIQLLPNDGTTQAAVTAALKDLLERDAEPGGTLLHSRIGEAISTAAGEEDHNLVAPTDNVTVQAGELLTLGTITFQDMP